MTDTTTSSSGSSEDSIYFENLVADRYKLLDLIGGGAFGSVYRAKDTENVGKV
jgi:serine/threonine protein kinase